MTERKITIVEYHSHGDGPRFFSDLFETPSETTGATEEEDVEEDDGGRRLAPLIALVLIAALAAGYRYFRSGSEEPTFETEQVEVTEYEN